VRQALTQVNHRARATWLTVGFWSLVIDRRRFESFGRAAAALAITSIDTMWRLRRTRRLDGCHDRVIARVAVASDLASIFLCAEATPRDAQFDALPIWAFAVMLFDLADLSINDSVVSSAVLGGIAAGAYSAATLRRSRGSDASTAVVFSIQMLMFVAVGAIVARVLQSGEADFDSLQERHEAAQRRIAEEREVDRMQRHLLRAIQAASAEIAESLSTDRTRARRRAAGIAQQLRAVLSSPVNNLAPDLVDAVHAAVIDAAGLGVTVECTLRLEAGVAVHIVDPVAAALRAALQNVAVHAQVDRAVLRVSVDRDHLVVTLRDRGRGREALSAIDVTSVVAPLVAIGAHVEFESSAGGGTRVQISVSQ
jgi:hypothetical protein